MIDERYRTEPFTAPDGWDWRTLEAHPSANAQRMMNEREEKALRALLMEGYDPNRPIVLIRDKDGQPRIGDGRNRKQQCVILDELGALKTPPVFHLLVGTALPAEYVGHTWQVTECHKKLSSEDDADRVVAIKERWEIENKARNDEILRANAEFGKEGGRGNRKTLVSAPADTRVSDPPQPKPTSGKSRSVQLAANATGWEFNKVDRLARLKRFAPDLYEIGRSEPSKIKRLIEDLQKRSEDHFAKTGQELPAQDGSGKTYLRKKLKAPAARESGETSGPKDAAPRNQGDETSPALTEPANRSASPNSCPSVAMSVIGMLHSCDGTQVERNSLRYFAG